MLRPSYMEAEAHLPQLPSEIICFQILPRLPAKSLMRFKCVCKSWFSLTRNPSFLRVHRNLRCNSSNMYTHLLLHFYDETALHERLLSLQINQDGSPSLLTHCLTLPYEYRLYQTYSSNGLVLLKLGNALIYDHPIRIFNPCTRESITLPLPNFPTHISYPWFQIVHLFGFSPLTNEYKVLQVQYRMSLGESARTIHGFTFKIFTLGTHAWRNIEVDHLPFDPHTWDFLKKSVCVNGSLHWLTGYRFASIVVFDLGEERMRAIPIPEDYVPEAELCELDGCLALINPESFDIWSEDGELREQDDFIELWILKDYQNHVWIKHTVTFPIHLRGSRDHERPSLCTIHPILSCFPLCTIHAGVLMLQCATQTHLSLYVYDMKSKTFRRSEIMLPERLRGDVRLELLSTYDDENIVPLR